MCVRACVNNMKINLYILHDIVILTYKPSESVPTHSRDSVWTTTPAGQQQQQQRSVLVPRTFLPKQRYKSYFVLFCSNFYDVRDVQNLAIFYPVMRQKTTQKTKYETLVSTIKWQMKMFHISTVTALSVSHIANTMQKKFYKNNTQTNNQCD